MQKKSLLKFLITLIITLLFTTSLSASVTLEDASLKKYKKYDCGYVSNSWQAGVKRGNTFESYKEISLKNRNSAKANKNNKLIKAYYIKLAQRAEASLKAAGAGCRKLSAPTSSKAITLTKLPNVSSLVKENVSASFIRGRAASGTPPVLATIGTVGSKNVFWNPGLIDAIKNNTATPEQCTQFFNSTTDGQSAGYGGCQMSQSVLSNLGEAINSGNTLCYMKNVATQNAINNGALRVVLGSLPSGGISSLFTSPSGSNGRIVGIANPNGGYSDFIKVYSNSENSASEDRYRFDYWSCEGNIPSEIQQIRIMNSGEYSINSYQQNSDGNGSFNITARVIFGEDGSISFDSTRDRTLVSNFIRSNGGNKLLATISGDNKITSKYFNTFSTDTQYGVSVANFSGTGFRDLRFVSGAFKDRFFSNSSLLFSTLAGMEYRNTNYKIASELADIATVSSVDLLTDPYFTTPTATTAPTGFSCSTTPDIGVAINFESQAMLAIREICEGGRVENIGFCWQDADLNAAQSAYNTSCNR